MSVANVDLKPIAVIFSLNVDKDKMKMVLVIGLVIVLSGVVQLARHLL